MITPGLQDEIEEHLGKRIATIAPLSSAATVQIFRLLCDDGSTCVAKIANKGMDTEADMLSYLRENTQLPVPDVYYNKPHIIIMSYIESNHSLDHGGQKDAAHHLAELHKIKSNTYGFEKDTMIAGFKQPNNPTTDWVEFFTHQRLLHVASAALQEGKIDSKFMAMTEKLAGKLSGYLKDALPPVLIHGDIWSGNILAGRGKVAAFLDPAIYFADPEIELAFITLFNTFDENFFAAYNEIHPIREGFKERAELYNIYPLLIHARLFGPSYTRKAKRILEKFV